MEGVSHARYLVSLEELDRFGDNWYVCCANFPCVGGRHQFINTKFTNSFTKISRSKVPRLMQRPAPLKLKLERS